MASLEELKYIIDPKLYDYLKDLEDRINPAPKSQVTDSKEKK
jgi:hypothetical protein